VFKLPSASHLRREILNMAYAGQSVHVPSAFSVVEIVRVLHESVIQYPNNDPDDPERDYLVLSKGHGAMALYPILAARGWIQGDALENYFADGSLLPGLTEACIPGCEANTGSLGQGITVAAGLALGAKLRGSNQRVFCIIGDGELNEGSVYEALAFAAHNQLSNMTVILDENRFQAMGKTNEILGSMNVDVFFESLGFSVFRLDGHDESALTQALASDHFIESNANPTVIVAETVKGKGVSFMEEVNEWHYRRLSPEEHHRALEELDS